MFSVPVYLKSPAFTPPIIENLEHRFTCEADGGSPGAVIKWYVNGETPDGVVKQINNTNTQTSTLTLTSKRSMHTVACIAEQVHNKPPVYGGNATLDVLCG